MQQTLETPSEGMGPKVNVHGRIVTDHEGREHPSIAAMCRYWGINEKVYWARVRLLDWPLEKILTEPVHEMSDTANAIKVLDHENRSHGSISAMCRYWHVGLSTYRERRKRGWTLEQALTGSLKMDRKIENKPCSDHTGRSFPSESAMCRAWGITRCCYSGRIKAGWDKKTALTEPMVVNAKPCQDYMGREFPSTKDMANFLGLPRYAFQGRKITDGLIRQLCTGAWSDRSCGRWQIESCIGFPWFKGLYENRPAIAHFETLLDEYHQTEFDPIPETNAIHGPVKPVRLIKWPWYLTSYYGRPAILDYWRMIRLHAESNFGLSPENRINKNDKGE